MRISVSFLELSFSRWESWLKEIKTTGIKHLHYDVMDGHFVPSITFGHRQLKKIKKLNFVIDGHFMVNLTTKTFAQWKVFNAF